MNYIFTSTHTGTSEPDAAQIGGKGLHLRELQAMGCTVPMWYAVTTELFAAFIAGNDLSGRIKEELQALKSDSTLDRIEEHSARIRAMITGAVLTQELREAVMSGHQDMHKPAYCGPCGLRRLMRTVKGHRSRGCMTVFCLSGKRTSYKQY